MIDRIKKSISDSGLAVRGDRLLIALSGGADSVCLLLILRALMEEKGFEIAAAHFNHGIRENAARDEDFCRDLCKKTGVPFFSGSGDVPRFARENGLSTETAARLLRYDFLYDICKKEGFNKLASAHQLNDSAESIVMHLIRGSGLAGLTGIKSMTRDEKHGVTLIRPLLPFTKDEILTCIAELGADHCEDETNFETDAARNYLRIEILPRIEKNINQAAIRNICRAGSIAAEDEDYLSSAAACELEKARTKNGFSRKKLALLPPPIQKRCIRLALAEKNTLVDVEENHILSVSELLKMNSGAGIDIPHSRVRVSFDELLIEPPEIKKDNEQGVFDLVIGKGCTETPFGVFEMDIIPVSRLSSMEKPGDLEYNIKKLSDRYTALMDIDRLTGPLTVRTRRPGDRFKPVNSAWNMKLKDYFIGKKVDEKQRGSVPLVLSGEQIVFIPGFTVSDNVKLTNETKTVLWLKFAPKRSENGE